MLYLVESCRTMPPAMLLLWVLTLTRVIFRGRLGLEMILCPSRGDSALATFSNGSLIFLRSSALSSSSSSSSSSIVPGSRKSFGDSSIVSVFLLRKKKINLILIPYRRNAFFSHFFFALGFSSSNCLRLIFSPKPPHLDSLRPCETKQHR